MLINIVVISIAISNFILGLMSLFRNRKQKINIFFFLVTLGIAIWCVGINFFRGLPLEFSYIFGNMVYLGVSIAIVAFLFFSYVFPRGSLPKNIFFWTLTIFGSLVLVLTSVLPNLIFKDIQGAGVNKVLIFNYGFYIHSLITVVFFVVAFINLLVKYYKVTGVTKTQLRYFYFGSLLTCATGIIFNIMLPSLGNASLNWLGPSGTIFLAGFTAYAIVKHRLMDIRMVVARSVAYIILLITLAGLYAGSVLGLERLFFPSEANNFSLSQGALRTAIAVIMVFLFQPLRRWITAATDKIFFKNQYDPEDLLGDLSHTIGSTIVLIEMLYKVNDLLVKNIKVSRSAFVLFKDDSDEPYTSPFSSTFRGIIIEASYLWSNLL